MDIGHFYSPPTELNRTRPEQQISKSSTKGAVKIKAYTRSGDTSKAAMDNKGWRKKIGGTPKDLPPLKTTLEEAAPVVPSEVAPEQTDRRRHGWRKTIVTSRPQTPATPAPITPTVEQMDDTTSERSKALAPRRDSKPKLIRYTSLFTTHKEESTSPICSNPWSADVIPDQEDPWSYVDPIVIMESIYSHMCKNYMVPVPIHYTSGLFQIFDDYRKLRTQKEALETRERDALQHARNVTVKWLESEDAHRFEIRRLELLIARGTNGMAGLVQARKGTVVDRKRQHRKTISTDRVLPEYQRMSLEDIDEGIKAKVQQVRLHRPVSPSGKMTALSRQLTDGEVPDLPMGTPPNAHRGLTLSRKVQSELNLEEMRYKDASLPGIDAEMTAKWDSAQGVSQTGTAEADQLTKYALECDAFVALRELGALVACRRGLDVANFVNGLMALFGSTNIAKTVNTSQASEDVAKNSMLGDVAPLSADDKTPRPPLRMSRSRSYQEINHQSRRHFSFEPGDDRFQELENDLRACETLSQATSTDSDSASSAGFALFDDGLQTSDVEGSPLLMSASMDCTKPSLIPSPVQTSGRVRRENSMSSLQTVFNKSTQDGRHNSQISIQTAFREASSADTSTNSQSRSSSEHNLRAVGSSSGSRDRLKSVVNRQGTAALAAARAAEAKSSIPSRSSTQASTATTFPHKRHGTARQRTENTDPITCKDAGD